MDFLQQHLVIPETNAAIELHPEQQRVIDAMFKRDSEQHFLYSTMLYSSIKKSAKTTIGGGLGLWQGWRVPNGQIYIVGNDLKQADNRMMQAIRYSVEHNGDMKHRVRIIRNTIYLDNGTKIEAVPVDAAGEAGSNPTGIFWTEVWGAKQKKHEKMWSEMALSPTRQGESFKFAESYAGHSGESLILERLYEAVVKHGVVLDPDISPELYVSGRSIAYWNTRRYLPWQIENDDYYRQEALEKTPAEFSRQHENKWASSTNAFMPIEWWDACKGELPTFDKNVPMVIGIDAAVTHDCFAIVGVSRRGDTCYVRYVNVWTPPPNGKIDFSEPEAEIRRLAREYYLACGVYDPMQFEDMAQRLTRDGIAWFESFTQGAPRLEADTALYQHILRRDIVQDGNPTLREHLLNSDSEIDPEGHKMRIVHRAPHLPMDASVALSMATAQAYYLNIG